MTSSRPSYSFSRFREKMSSTGYIIGNSTPLSRVVVPAPFALRLTLFTHSLALRFTHYSMLVPSNYSLRNGCSP